MGSKKPTKRKYKTGAGRPKGSLSSTQHPACKLSNKIIEDFVAIIEKGNFRSVARQRLGITVSTYDKWINTGRKQIREFEAGKRKHLLLQGKFVLALDEAEGRIHGQMVEDILDKGSIQAKQWYLERRFNKLYSRNPSAHIDDETGKEVQIDASTILAERLKALVNDS